MNSVVGALFKKKLTDSLPQPYLGEILVHALMPVLPDRHGRQFKGRPEGGQSLHVGKGGGDDLGHGRQQFAVADDEWNVHEVLGAQDDPALNPRLMDHLFILLLSVPLADEGDVLCARIVLAGDRASQHWGRSLARQTKGCSNSSHKARRRKQNRANDTLAHFWRWFEYGPDHIEAQRSIEQVKHIHEAMAKMVAEAFTNDDFIYTTCWLGTKPHRMRLIMELPGFSAKQKIAAHHFWQGVMLKMRGPHGYVHRYPKSFEEMEAFVDRFEARDWPQTDSGKELADYVIEQFNEARLAKPLWGLGQQLILTFQAKHIRDLHRMGDPNPVAAWLI